MERNSKDYEGLSALEFEKKLHWDVAIANRDIRGQSQAPWEVVMEALIAVKKELARKF